MLLTSFTGYSVFFFLRGKLNQKNREHIGKREKSTPVGKFRQKHLINDLNHRTKIEKLKRLILAAESNTIFRPQEKGFVPISLKNLRSNGTKISFFSLFN